MKYMVVATALLVAINPALATNKTKPETIIILGNTYKIRPDINEDVIWKWSLLKPYLPKELFVKPAKKMSDQEVFRPLSTSRRKRTALC